MVNTIKRLLGVGAPVNIEQLIQQGATVVDVRTRSEYTKKHIRGSVNIPLDELESSLGKLSKSKTIVTCCASGIRSATANVILRSNGFAYVHNGGSWASLQTKMR